MERLAQRRGRGSLSSKLFSVSSLKKGRMESPAEIEEKLASLLEQYKQVETALSVEPENEELLLAKKELSEVITMTEDLYNLKRNEEEEKQKAHTSTTTTTDPQNNLKVATGTKIEAVYSGDSRWYPAVVTGVADSGNYKVRFLGYGNAEEEVKPDDTREKPKKPKEESASKKRAREEESKTLKIPDNLKILPTDSEEVRQKKKRKVKNIKTKIRMKELEKVRDSKKQTWQSFAAKKSRRVGFFTGGKKESIFKSPDSVTGKVGVTGSGAAMTPYQTIAETGIKKKLKPELLEILREK